MLKLINLNPEKIKEEDQYFFISYAFLNKDKKMDDGFIISSGEKLRALRIEENMIRVESLDEKSNESKGVIFWIKKDDVDSWFEEKTFFNKEKSIEIKKKILGDWI